MRKPLGPREPARAAPRRAPPGGPRRPPARPTTSTWTARALALAALVGAVIAFILIVSGGGSSHPTSTAAASHSRPVRRARHRRHARRPTHKTAQQAFRVGFVGFTLSEPSAPAIANGQTSSGAPARQIPVGVRYPAGGTPDGHDNPGAPPALANAPYPLIVFSQGYDTAPSTYAWLMNQWASAGYVVAAPTYPFTDPTVPGGPNENDIVNHPADLRFVISKLLHSTGSLKRLVDTQHVALIGQSDGGDVSLAVSANTCCRDAAVKAAVILSGAELARFGGSYYAGGPNPPLLAVQGSADAINPPGCSAQLYDGSPPPKYYLDLLGAPHLPPYTQPGRDRMVVATATIAFLDRFLKGQRSALTALRRSATVPGVAALLTGATVPSTNFFCPGAP